MNCWPIFVNSVYIQPEVSSPELVNYLTSKNIQPIGVEGQAGLSDAPNWVLCWLQRMSRTLHRSWTRYSPAIRRLPAVG